LIDQNPIFCSINFYNGKLSHLFSFFLSRCVCIFLLAKLYSIIRAWNYFPTHTVKECFKSDLGCMLMPQVCSAWPNENKFWAECTYGIKKFTSECTTPLKLTKHWALIPRILTGLKSFSMNKLLSCLSIFAYRKFTYSERFYYNQTIIFDKI